MDSVLRLYAPARVRRLLWHLAEPLVHKVTYILLLDVIAVVGTLNFLLTAKAGEFRRGYLETSLARNRTSIQVALKVARQKL